MRISAINTAQDSGIPRTAYPRYEALEWVPIGATPQEAAPIYRPQPQYRWYTRTLPPQPHQPPDYHPMAAPPIMAASPLYYVHGKGPQGPLNSELDLGRRQPGAPKLVVPGSNAALAIGPSYARTFIPTR